MDTSKSLSGQIREKMKSENKRFWAGDNISEYLHNNEYLKSQLIEEATQMLGSSGFEVDYVEILNYDLTPFNHNDSNKNSVALIAATIDSIRLIDNILLGESTDSN